MSTHIIPRKLEKLVDHLRQNGNEELAGRVIKVLDEEQIADYLAAAKAEIAKGSPAPTKKAAKKAAKKAKPAPEPDPEPEEEIDEDYEVEEDEVEVEEDEVEVEEDEVEVEEDEVEEDEVEEDEVEVEEDEVEVEEDEVEEDEVEGVVYERITEQGTIEPLQFHTKRGNRIILKDKLDRSVTVNLGGEMVEVNHDQLVSSPEKGFTTPGGKTFARDVVLNATSLALGL